MESYILKLLMINVTQRTLQHEWFSDNIDYLVPPCTFDPEHKSIDSFQKEDVLPLGIIRSGMKKRTKEDSAVRTKNI